MAQRRNPLDRYLDTLGIGRVEWIGVRPQRREPLRSVEQVNAVQEYGLEGDHRMSKTPGSGRQVTLISREFIQQISDHLGRDDLAPARLRRNIVISGINLNALRRQRFWVGAALLEATQLCHPCARMESELGPGAVVAMFGYGGLCAKVVSGGAIACRDRVSLAEQA
ncbi:MAG: MOSC domain-containing protein [Luminiphilus sp.]|jgi:MOSC domain-containing protein YiiM|nr:MOSC domain-containing protein [Luminiphilus sp.]